MNRDGQDEEREPDTEQGSPHAEPDVTADETTPDPVNEGRSGGVPGMRLPDLSRSFENLRRLGEHWRAIDQASNALRQGLAHQIAYEFVLPKLDLSAFITATRFAPKFDFNLFGATFKSSLDRLHASQPPNWPDDVDLDLIPTIVQDEGIPLVWVPRGEIVTALLAEPDRAARVAILVSRAAELVEDCRAVLADVSHPSVVAQVPLALRAVEALNDGHHEAAQALAVTVTETAVSHVLGDEYAKVKQEVLFDPDLILYRELRLRAALAPIGPFYTRWYRSSGDPAPDELSRHVTVHEADANHYTPGNGVVAVLLLTSVLRALQELQEVAEASEESTA